MPIAHSALGGSGPDGHSALAADSAMHASRALAGRTSIGSTPSTAQLLIRWALRRGAAVVASTSRPERASEVLNAPFVPIASLALDRLDTIPRERHRRRVKPAPFAFLFDDE